MAVYTEIDEESLRNFIEKYDIGHLKAYHGINEGVENTNYYIKTTVGSFILTLYEKRTREEDLPFFIGLMRHLAAFLDVPQPIQQKTGIYLDYLKGRPCALTSFLQGESLQKSTVSACSLVGTTLAQLHHATKTYPMERENNLTLEAWRPLWNKSKPYIDELFSVLGRAIEQEIDHELDFLEKTWPKNLPKGIIHADLFMDNVFFKEQHLTGIIDFYFACHDMLSYDLAITLNAWCFTSKFSYDLNKGKALLEAYNQVRCLTHTEREAFPILLRGAAMRFFLTRLYDWFHVDGDKIVTKKHPLEYWQKLQFFQKIEHMKQLGLS